MQVQSLDGFLGGLLSGEARLLVSLGPAGILGLL